MIKIKDFIFLATAGTVVLYEKTTITDMNSTGSSGSTVSDEEFGTVNIKVVLHFIVLMISFY